MSDETLRLLWDQLYEDLINGQAAAKRILGDTKAQPLVEALEAACRLAEDLAPAGWSVADRTLLT